MKNNKQQSPTNNNETVITNKYQISYFMVFLGVVKALIVLFIAAPPIIRAIYRLPKPMPELSLPAIKVKKGGRG